MSKIARCQNCRGSKIVMGLGGMEKKCKVCKGVGYMPKVDEKDEDEFLSKKVVESKPAKKSKPKEKRI